LLITRVFSFLFSRYFFLLFLGVLGVLIVKKPHCNRTK